MPLPYFAQQVFPWYHTVLEKQLPGTRPLYTHLVLLFSKSEAGCIPFYYKSAEFIATLLGEYCENIGKSRIGDPYLLAVERIVLSVGAEGCCCLCSQRI